MENIFFKTKEIPKQDLFATEDIAYNCRLVQSEYITDYYFYGTTQKIYSFASIMNENLTYGFMHYHIPTKYHAYFSEKYPELRKATNQIHYLYTAEKYRLKNYASKLLDYILEDMLAQGFAYIWLRSSINPKLYHSKGFLQFTDALQKICLHYEDFIKDYEDKIGSKEHLNRAFGDIRLVKIFN